MGVLLNLTIPAEFNILVKRSKEKPQLKLTILKTKARFIEKSGAVVNLGLGTDYDAEKFKKALE